MEFFKNIKRSIYDPDYYRGLISKPFSYSLKYFLLFVFLATVISTVVYSVTFLPLIKKGIIDLADVAIQQYPDELEVVIKGGQASTNVEEPYFIKYPWRDESGRLSIKYENGQAVDTGEYTYPENLLVIDTSEGFNEGKLAEYDTMMLLTKTSIISSEGGRISITPLNEYPDFTINKQAIIQIRDKALPYLQHIYWIGAIIIFIACWIALVARLIYLLVAAFFIWGIAHAKNIKIGWSKSYQIGLHLMTLPMILSLIPVFSTIPFFFTMALLVMAAFNLKAAPVSASVETTAGGMPSGSEGAPAKQ